MCLPSNLGGPLILCPLNSLRVALNGLFKGKKQSGTIGLADSNLGMLGGLNYRLPRIQENIKMASTTFC